jgi:hypothetical protein
LAYAAGVAYSDFPFFPGDFFALAGAGLAFAGLAFVCAFFAFGFGFCFCACAYLSLAQRAFAAALIFALASAESLRRSSGPAAFAVLPAGCPSIIAARFARVSRDSAICASRPMMARRSNSAGSSFLVVGIDQTFNKVLVETSGVLPPQAPIDDNRGGERCEDDSQNVMWRQRL